MLRVEPKDNDVILISFLIMRERSWEVRSGVVVERDTKIIAETVGTFMASLPLSTYRLRKLPLR